MDSLMVLLTSRILTILLLTNIVQGLTQFQEMELKKPVIKSFETEYGDIVDCVDIYKQPAFDNPLLTNHTIQMAPTFDVIPNQFVKSSVRLTTLQLLSKDGTPIICPKRTVPIRRTLKEDLLTSKFSTSFYLNSEPDQLIEHTAGLEMITNNSGVHGMVNLWQPNATTHQFTGVYIYVASEDKSVSNILRAGWSVDAINYKKNVTRFYASWTKDSGKTTGCVDLQCPGFVKVSPDPITLGMELDVGDKYGSADQAEMPMSILQDPKTGNWWVTLASLKIGYYPKELFTTLAGGATRVGWGGIVKSPKTDPAPAMGNGHYPEEGLTKSCYIRRLYYVDKSNVKYEPQPTQVKEYNTKPECYKVSGVLDGGSFRGEYMFVGGPPNCKSF